VAKELTIPTEQQEWTNSDVGLAFVNTVNQLLFENRFISQPKGGWRQEETHKIWVRFKVELEVTRLGLFFHLLE
jgi:hypothetical protein